MSQARKKSNCPYCGAAMRPVVMACDSCQVEIRGRFRQTLFSRLPMEDLEFLERYLLAEFSIKALAEKSGLGYVAIRNRLDRAIESYRKLLGNEDAKRAILDQLDRGEISAEAAAEALERL
ncbi:DUF2089 family protein [Candidatus Sumerlaeota bacterium]|nr:DUF2089 family protein [Candidatus Sumerlaeota bacterium]